MFRALRLRRCPSVVDCSILSLIVYYDIGLVLETLGIRGDGKEFLPFFSATPQDMLWPTLFIAIAPWMLRVGEIVVGTQRKKLGRKIKLANSRRFLFFLVSFAIVGCSLYYGLSSTSEDSIWGARAEIGNALGEFIIVLYLPIYLLAFFTQVEESTSVVGTLYCLVLVFASMASTVFIGERTLLLMPLLIFALFRFDITTKRLFVIGMMGVVLAAALLPVFKWQFASKQEPEQLFVSTVLGDLYRAPVLIESARQSPLFGTNVMPYPGAGYVYAALFVVPRKLATMKGQSTAVWFTADVTNDKVEDTKWGFGISAIDEILLNFGKVLVLPGLILYGLGLALLDRLSSSFPATLGSTRLFGIWVMGYHLPALMLLFGGMIVMSVVLDLAFASSVSQSKKGRPRERTSLPASQYRYAGL